MADREWALNKRVQTQHGAVAYDVFGTGAPIILVHGTPSHSMIWRRIAPALARDHQVFLWDLLGFGASQSSKQESLSLVGHGQTLAELVESWGLDRPSLVGHDIGGAVSLRAHLLEGVEISRLVLIDAVVLRPWITERSREVQRKFTDRHLLPSDELGRMITEHLRSATAKPLSPELFRALFGQWEGGEGQRRYLRNLAQLDETHTAELEPRLQTVSAPTLLLWGEQDAWLPVEASQRIATAIPGARRVLVPDAGHFSMEDQPGRVSVALEDFLEAA